MIEEMIEEMYSEPTLIEVGHELIDATFYERVDGEFVQTKLRDKTVDKRVIIFAIPGAFTPTCSSTHLPGFEAKYQEFRDLGIDEIYCLCPNDAFVTNAWFKDLGIENVKPIPDGNLQFTLQENMMVLKDNLGFGPRTWRYAIVVDNKVVTHTFIEEGKADRIDTDPFEVSSAENVYSALTSEE